MNRNELVKYLDNLLNHSNIKDSSINWLQFEWKSEVKKIALAVDACLLSYKKAIESWCDMILTHHWILWWSLQKINWAFKKQIEFLVKNDLNLYASHLPLDLHSEYWNNIELARILWLKNTEDFWFYKWNYVWFSWELKKEKTIEEISDIFQAKLLGESIFLPFGPKVNKRIWIISGGWGVSIPEAIELWLDCFVTWEWSHQTHHLALEWNLNVIYLGHYHSEKLWVIALWNHLKEKFWLDVEFLDVPTIV